MRAPHHSQVTRGAVGLAEVAIARSEQSLSGPIEELMGPLGRLPERRYRRPLRSHSCRHSWREDDLALVVSRLGPASSRLVGYR
jgi:hypothetical protein